MKIFEFINIKIPGKTYFVFKKIAGVLLVVLGIAGLILPLLPGWIFIFIGLELLGIHLLFIQQIKDKIWHKKRTKSDNRS